MKLTLNGRVLEFSDGTTYGELLRRESLGAGALGVSVGGATYSLCDAALDGAEVSVLTLREDEGRRIYERTALMLLLCALKRVLPKAMLRVEHSFGNGVYACAKDQTMTPSQVEAVAREMRALAEADLPIVRRDVPKEEAAAYFAETGQEDKLQLMQYRVQDDFTLYEMDGQKAYFYGEMAPSAAYARVFALRAYYPGMVLLLPGADDPEHAAKFKDMPQLARTFAQSAQWNRILGCSNAADLNQMIESRQLREFIRVNEALQEKRIAEIAEQFKASGARVVLIAGPSSSGKTTTSHRLLIALRVLGYRPVKVSLDDYYTDRSLAPLGPDGQPDLERIDILDLPLLNEHLLQLLRGETIQAPEYDFVAGKRSPRTHEMRVEDGQPIILEGIHGLNDALTSAVPRQMKFKIYVSALTTLNLDDHNRISTTDMRLLRRIVRDYLFRGTAPEQTMLLWPGVRRGEENYIFPYQEQADAMFNSSLVYETLIMKKYVYPILAAVDPKSPCYTMAGRLVKFLNYFRTADVEDEIPVNSILREFIGGCCFYRDED